MLILFLLLGALFKRSVALNGAPLLGAAKRTLDSEDRSEMIGQEERKGEKVGRHNGPVARRLRQLTATNNNADAANPALCSKYGVTSAKEPSS